MEAAVARLTVMRKDMFARTTIEHSNHKEDPRQRAKTRFRGFFYSFKHYSGRLFFY